MSRWSAVLVPLGLGIWATFSLGLLLANGSYALAVISDPFGWGWNLFGTVDATWAPLATSILPLLQTLVLLATLAGSVVVARCTAKGAGLPNKAAVPTSGFCLALTWLALGVFIGW